jgi:ATP-binding cassette subfamily C (CFTR/MRP) protein 4
LDIEKGTVVGVCGPVGAGKSTLLNAILGEIAPMSSGTVSRRKRPYSIAYASQTSWIMSGTIKENVLFGKEYDKDWFGKVVSACSLDKDLANMPDREETFIGERGVTLSGGQRARLALARAVYHDADMYLLDDPLSAVDPKVGKHIFDACIRGLLKQKVKERCIEYNPIILLRLWYWFPINFNTSRTVMSSY